jgi:DEAD/DEAH box helicase domain-containing protein
VTPSLLSREIAEGLAAFLRTTFPITSPFFEQALEKFLTKPGGLFTGPWVQLRLPFRQASNFTDPFDGLLPEGFLPYLHQQQAFLRLHHRSVQSTLVATGTGSGKTESFLYPILDHCRRQAGRPGIKAILIYPMNALATDQARRIAALIHGHPDLHNRITAGVYLGEGEDSFSRPKSNAMGKQNLIDDRTTLRASPPDILLTNYKMLDLLLLRPDDYKLWAQNMPDTFRYLVVDELHTFDGAQGADLACLVRRLKQRLATPPGQLCCVGTSATLGDSVASSADLVQFATYLFGETFSPNSVIGETLQTIEEFLAGEIFEFFSFPTPEALVQLGGTPTSYLNAAYRLWFPSGQQFELDPEQFNDASVQLGRHLRRHSFLRNFLVLLEGQPRSFSTLIELFHARFSQLLPGTAPEHYLESLLASFIALVSHARTKLPSGHLVPFLPVRLQLWLRELSRVVASVSPSPELRFSDDLSAEDLAQSLPLLHCRECGLTGWGAVLRDGDSRLDAVLKNFYSHFFSLSPHTVFLFDHQDNPVQTGKDTWQLCPKCLNLQYHPKPHNCDRCGHPKDSMLHVWRPDVAEENHRASGKVDRKVPHHCPRCAGHNSLTILGSRAASLLSVAFSQLYQSPNNNDKKLLAFSDNVQDASHRAGFFSARTWSTNFRTALQQLVQSIAANEPNIPFVGLTDRFRNYYLQQTQPVLPNQHHSPERFATLFLSPDMDWMDDFLALRDKGTLPAGSGLIELILRRMDWEIWAEYTFNSRIGRTLEKSASSMLSPKQDRFEAALEDLLVHLPEQIGELREVPKEDLAKSLAPFLLTFLNELRRRGAVFHPHLYPYIESDGNTFLLGKRKPGSGFEPWRPSISNAGRRPAFLTPLSKHPVFLPILASNSSRPTWFEEQFFKAFSPFHALAASLSASFYQQVLLPCLERVGLLARHATTKSDNYRSDNYKQGNFVWGIPREAYELTLNIVPLRCDTCRYSIQVPQAYEAPMSGSPCPNSACRGRLLLDRQPELNFYRQLYQNGQLERIYAAEHTGLLTREKREALEDAFRSSGKPATPNLLSCTPTLEMGINIGDLSSVALCSVPPKPANYLQRIGRAGRSNGNALVLTVASTKPHDLFFYLQPEEMIRGQVDSPGLFLEAAAVLERQFTAFVFDSWTLASKGGNRLPQRVLDAIQGLNDPRENAARFPNNLLLYFDSNRTALEDAFLALFSPFWAPEKREALSASLRSFSRGEKNDRPDMLGLVEGILDSLRREESERTDIKKRLSRLRTLLKDLPQQSALKDDTIETDKQAIESEDRALKLLLTELEDRDLLGFLTDAGLLPNYAFPESGVTLRSVILRSAGKGSTTPQRDRATYVRPASAGLLELAPSNTFYAEGRRLEIDSVSFDPKDYKPWRICPACNYLAPEHDVQNLAACPNCSDPLFADAGQLKHLLRLRSVTSTMTDFASRSYDESDDRDVVFFQRHTFTNFDKKNITRAWRYPTDDLPFGFEFLNRVALRDVNFGKAMPGNSTKLRFAGKEIEDRPFLICSDCGKVKKGDTFVHAPFCRHWNSSQKQNAKDPGIKASFLYREIHSEAIRILLPIGLVDADKNFDSFVAALALGLRRYFKGETAHLQTCKMDEPSSDPRARKQYLVLYDSVPGGTGYLKDLMRDASHLMQVFSLALDALKACSCNLDATKDGCYRCLLYYRTRHNSGNTSRRAAIELLEPIVRKRDELKEVTNLDHLQINRFLESQLEARFVEGLRRFSERAAAKESRLDTTPINGKTGYTLKLGNDLWQIEPQVWLDSADGVDLKQRVDFLLTPLRARPGERPIAVSTDGYEFHAGDNNRLREDTLQRFALQRSGRYRFWSLTWEDVETAFLPDSEPESYTSSLLPPNLDLQNRLLGNEAFACRDLNHRNSFALLCDLLTRGREWQWQRYALSLVLGLPRRQRLSSQSIVSRWTSTFPVAAQLPIPAGESNLSSIESALFSLDALLSDGFASSLGAGIAAADVTLPIVIARFDDRAPHASTPDHKKYWRDFLRVMNLLQCLPGSIVLSTKAWEDPVLPTWLALGARPASGLWGDLAQELDPAFLDLLKFAADQQLPVPESPFELFEHDEIVAFSQLAWPKHLIAILPADQTDFADFEERFHRAGFQVFTPASALEERDKFLALFPGLSNANMETSQ